MRGNEARARALSDEERPCNRALNAARFGDPAASRLEGALISCATLHQVQEYAARQGDRMPRTHAQRKDYIMCNLPEVSRAYEILQTMSVTARYDPHAELTGLSVKYAKELRQYILSAIA